MRSSLFSYYRGTFSNSASDANRDVPLKTHSGSDAIGKQWNILSQTAFKNCSIAFSVGAAEDLQTSAGPSDIHTFSILAQAERNIARELVVPINDKNKRTVDRSAFISSLGPLQGGEPKVDLIPRVVAHDLVISKNSNHNRGFEAEFKEDPQSMAFMESCIVRACGALVAGGAMGFFFGVMFSSLGTMGNPPIPGQMQANIMAENFRVSQAAAGQPAAPVPPQPAVAPVPGAPAPASGTSALSSTLSGVRTNSSLAVESAKNWLQGAVSTSTTAARPGVPGIPGMPSQPVAAVTEHAAAAQSMARTAAVAHGAPVATAPGSMFLPNALPGALPSSPVALEDMTIRQAFRQGIADMKVRGIQSAKSFGMVGGLYTVIECSIEKVCDSLCSYCCCFRTTLHSVHYRLSLAVYSLIEPFSYCRFVGSVT